MGRNIVELLEWVGRLGRLGGAILLSLGLGFVAVSYALSSEALPLSQRLEVVFYSPAVWLFSGLFILGGVFLLVTGGVWKRDERFLPMSAVELAAVVKARPTPFCVCLDCMLFLPYEVSVGRCPRCNSSASCLEVHNAEDRAMAINAIPG